MTIWNGPLSYLYTNGSAHEAFKAHGILFHKKHSDNHISDTNKHVIHHFSIILVGNHFVSIQIYKSYKIDIFSHKFMTFIMYTYQTQHIK